MLLWGLEKQNSNRTQRKERKGDLPWSKQTDYPFAFPYLDVPQMCISTRNPDPALRTVVTTQQVPLQHLDSFWLEREHCFLERCCLSPGSYCVIFCFILHISAFLLVIVRANVSVCAFLCIHLFLLSVSPVTLSNFCSYKLTQCCSNIRSPSAAEIPP